MFLLATKNKVHVLSVRDRTQHGSYSIKNYLKLERVQTQPLYIKALQNILVMSMHLP